MVCMDFSGEMWYKIFIFWAGRKALVHPRAGTFSPPLFVSGGLLSELSVFIDESGDFGPYELHSPYYVIALVFHDQGNDISREISHLRRHVSEQGFPETHAIHSAPLVRREANYAHLGMTERRKLFRHLFGFMRLADIKYKAFVFKKKEFENHDKMVSAVSRKVGGFVRENLAYFQSFDKIIVYYDNGQREITNLINAVFSTFLDADVRKVSPSDYSLFQAADMFCTLTLLEQKLVDAGLSKSEERFFMSVRGLKKNYLKPAKAKRLDL